MLNRLSEIIGKVPLFHKQYFEKFLVSCTVVAIIVFMYYDVFVLRFNALVVLCASVFVLGFSTAICKWVFATFPSTRSRIFFLAQLIVGSALAIKVLFLTKLWIIWIGAAVVITAHTYLLGLFMYNFKKWGDIGNGPQPEGADMNAPLERWRPLSIGLSCGPVAKEIDESVGHGFGVLDAPYDTELPDGQIALKGSPWTVSDLMDTGVEFQRAEDLREHFLEENENKKREDFMFVYPTQLIGKTAEELAEINKRLWEEAIRMYKDNHACAARLRAFFDKVFDAVHFVVIRVWSFISTVIGNGVGFANKCLNGVLSLKWFTWKQRVFLRLQRVKLNAFHRGLMAKLVSIRAAVVAKLEAVRDAHKAKAHRYLRGYHWLGLYVGGTSLLPFWTCISFVLTLWMHEMKFKKQFGLGLFGLGTGWGDPIVPAHFTCDPEDFAIQTEPGYVKPPEPPKPSVWETLKMGLLGWPTELRKLWDGLMGLLKPLWENLLAKIGSIFKRKQQ